MENVSKALIIAGSMLLFVVGFSYAMFLINKLNTTSREVLDTVTAIKYYDNIEVDNSAAKERNVGIETVISTLYRYYKESYSVKILDEDGKLLQLFDTSIEFQVAKSDPKLKGSIYMDKTKTAFMFNAPWTSNIEQYTSSRIDYFIKGTKGYINNVFVDYSEINFLEKYKNKTFKETFVEYTYSGETIFTEDGVETITGSTQEKNKIMIIYQVNND